MEAGPDKDDEADIDFKKFTDQVKKYFNRNFLIIVFVLFLVVLILVTKYAYWQGQYVQCNKLEGTPVMNTRTGEKFCKINKEDFCAFGNTTESSLFSSWD